MDENIFKAKLYMIRIVGIVFMVGAMIILVNASLDWSKALLVCSAVISAFICWLVPTPQIVITDLGIARLQRGISGKGYFDCLGKENAICDWDAVYSVSTYRSGIDGSLTTFLHYTADPNKRLVDGKWNIDESYPHNAVMIPSRIFREYPEIIKLVIQKAVKATHDKNTLEIINGIGIRRSGSRGDQELK